MRIRPLTALALLPVLALHGRLPGAEYHWNTSHYEVVTDISPDVSRRVGAEMESIHAEYMRRFGRFVSPSRERFRVFVYSRKEDYLRQVGEQWQHSGGMFLHGKRLLTCYMEKKSLPEVFRTLYHEGFHQFAHTRIALKLPVWLDEGMAGYYERTLPREKGYVTGDVSPNDLQRLRSMISENRYIPWPGFMTMTGEQWSQKVIEGDSNRNYVQAWSMVHFLIHGKKGRLVRQLDAYVGAVKRGRGAREAMAEAFGSNLGRLEAEWKHYVLEEMKPSERHRCWSNLYVLGRLLAYEWEQGNKYETFEGFIGDLPIEEYAGFTFTGYDGVMRSVPSREELERACRCPMDDGQSEGPYSYCFSFEKGAGAPPDIICPCHGLITIRARLLKKEDGSYWTIVDEKAGRARPKPSNKSKKKPRKYRYRRP